MKDLKNEYLNMTNDNVPDLWARIEAGIDKIDEEKKAAENASKDAENVKNTETVGNGENTESVNATDAKTTDNGGMKLVRISDYNPPKKVSKISKYMPIIAAAALVTISLGVYVLSKGGKGMNMSDSTASAPAADSYVASESAAMEEACYEDTADMAESDSGYADYTDNAGDSAYAEDVATESAMPDEPSEYTNDESASKNDVFEKGFAEGEKSELEKAAAGIGEEKSESEGTASSVFEGTLSLLSNEHYASLVDSEGSEKLIYISDEMLDEVKAVLSEGDSVVIRCVEMSLEAMAQNPEEFSDVSLSLTQIKNF